MTGHNSKEVSLCVHDGVDHKTGIQKRSDFTHVFAEPVAEMTHDRSIRIYPAADFIRQGQIMVVIDGLRAGDTGQHAFPSAAEAGINMGRESAGKDDLIGSSSLFIDPHGRPPLCGSQIHAGFRRRIMVVHLNTVEQFAPYNLFFLRR